jgi:predicted HicB family RNase H-like nuclease
MAKPPMVQKNFRIPAALYEAAMAKATEQQENLSDVVRDALTQYVNKD